MTVAEITRMEVFFVLGIYLGVPGLILACFTAWIERKRPMATRRRNR